ncbi:protein BIG GRAIN 1-like E [Cynara cardunculus var. scolymus]|uniref:Protein BIG GRAIN 1-like E n=1 Tax=Cynara cardunculus var. scolymus TaxID=59895 RepID=A0A118K371_CYNCS|nr:protein BIG GRAIN 1-like E [Cynara cardunculus var. scolymus]KVI05447.1 hypothetical protein Ccrd_016202 [Cynara cardunculus var. scolymus]
MSNRILPPSQPLKKPTHCRNGSDELDVFEAARYFSGATEVLSGAHKSVVSGESRNFGNAATQKYCMRPIGRMSLDMPNHRGNSIPLQAMLMDPMMPSSKEKKSKQPSSPGGKLAHFLNSLFNQTSSKKSKSKSTKDEDESSPGGWRRKRRSSISHFRSGSSSSTTTTTTTTTGSATIMSDSKSPFSTSTSSGFRTPPPYHIAVPHTPTKTASYRDPRSYSDLKTPASQITKIPINENLNKIETFNIKTDFSGRKMSFGNAFVEKVKGFDEKQDERRRHPHKYVSRDDIKEFKRFIDDEDEGNESDSSSDLFELTNCDLGYYSSGLPVYETTHMDSIKRGAPISN